VNLTHRGNAPASSRDDDTSTGSVLGLVPHQIRGQLASFSNLILEGKGYDKCTTCSRVVVDAYQEGGCDFLLKVWNDSRGVLEDVTGITDMLAETEAAMEGIELADGEDDWE
jgi:ubiquitin-like modifier-activating enzyme ATG7